MAQQVPAGALRGSDISAECTGVALDANPGPADIGEVPRCAIADVGNEC